MQGFARYARGCYLHNSSVAILCAVQASHFSNGFVDTFCLGGTFIWNTGKRGVERHWGGKRGKALWFFTLTLSILLQEWCSDMRQPALQGSVGADPDGRVSFQVEKPVSFHMGKKHQPIISSLGSIYFCTS